MNLIFYPWYFFLKNPSCIWDGKKSSMFWPYFSSKSYSIKSSSSSSSLSYDYPTLQHKTSRIHFINEVSSSFTSTTFLLFLFFKFLYSFSPINLWEFGTFFYSSLIIVTGRPISNSFNILSNLPPNLRYFSYNKDKVEGSDFTEFYIKTTYNLSVINFLCFSCSIFFNITWNTTVNVVTPKIQSNIVEATRLLIKFAYSSVPLFNIADTTGTITQKGRKQQHQHTATIDGVNKFWYYLFQFLTVTKNQ